MKAGKKARVVKMEVQILEVGEKQALEVQVEGEEEEEEKE